MVRSMEICKFDVCTFFFVNLHTAPRTQNARLHLYQVEFKAATILSLFKQFNLLITQLR